LDCEPVPALTTRQVGVKEEIAMREFRSLKLIWLFSPILLSVAGTIHDAWQQDKQVMIIADRCDWPKLMDVAV